jgi:hypothetical protein
MKYNNNNIKVIIIEDEQDLLILYREFLLIKGYLINLLIPKLQMF